MQEYMHAFFVLEFCVDKRLAMCPKPTQEVLSKLKEYIMSEYNCVLEQTKGSNP
jgi:hypothetical protein